MKNKNFIAGMIAGAFAIMLINMAYLKVTDKALFGATSKLQATEKIEVSEKLSMIKDILDKYYVDEIDEKLLNDSMEKSLYYGYVYGVNDTYTTYMDADVFKSYLESSDGRFAGIGISVTVDKNDKRITVNSSYKGFPAHNAGILPGDKIIGVDGNDITNLDLQEAVNLMKGEEGTKVKVTVYRESDKNVFDVDLVRAIVEVPTVIDKYIEDEIGYIMLTGFERVTTEQFKLAYDGLLAEGIKGLVIDVRNNPGGLLTVVTDIADILIPEGTIVYTEDKNGKQDIYTSDKSHIGIPLAILMNGNSASASEVLAGAIQDTKSGVLVGTQSYGKGVVQNLYPLPDDTAVKVTIAKYYTPNGVCIDGIGLTPDYLVEMSDELSYTIQDLTIDEDVQLQKAINVLKEKMN